MERFGGHVGGSDVHWRSHLSTAPTNDDQLAVIAPAGLNDLFDLRVRPNLLTPTPKAVYQDRMANKGWKETWPLLTIENVAD